MEDFEIGSEAKGMPCKHKFHHACIVPWLELHSSCSVCRFQLPSDNSKIEANGGRNNEERERERVGSLQAQNNSRIGVVEDKTGNGRRFLIPIPWLFDGLPFSSGSQSGGTLASPALPGSESSQGRRDENLNFVFF